MKQTKRPYRTLKLTTDGQRHLGAAIGTSYFRAQYAGEKVPKWCNELHRLVDFAKTQPHAAYSAFVQRILSQYTYLWERYQACTNSQNLLMM